MRYVIGVDLGATQLRAGLVGADGALLAHERTRTLLQGGPGAVIAQILGLIGRMRAAVPGGGALLGVGVGATGPLDPETGVVYAPPSLPGWYDLPLRDALAGPTGLPVALDNDANLAALGEWRFGAAVGLQHLVYLTISTGIGGGVISDGRLLRGRRGAAAELGQIILDADRGLGWEDLASGTALAAAAAAAMPANPGSMLHSLASPARLSAAHVARAAAAGDALAVALMDREAMLLGMGFASILHIFSPELLLVGGSVILENPGLLAQARALAYKRALVDLYREVPILPASLGDRAGVLGAAALAFLAAEGR
jgi:glucokinase